jgi:hypothetical protein
MSDLIVAVVLLAVTATVLFPKHVRRERDYGPLSRRAVSHVDHPSEGNVSDPDDHTVRPVGARVSDDHRRPHPQP